MSVYIRDMAMPTSCWLCDFQDCGNCTLNNHKVVDNCIIEDRRDDDCPLIPVHDHGRLIDADKLKFVCAGTQPAELDYIRRYQVDNAPTIIPADKVVEP